MSNFQSLAVGAVSPTTFPKEGVFVHFAPSGITLYLNLMNPDEYEQRALKAAHPTKIGILNYGRTGFLMIDFGDNYMLNAPFDVGIEPPENIPDLEKVRNGGLILLLIVGVNALNGKIFGIRGITLSGHVSKQIEKLISRQISEPVEPTLNELAIAAAYRRYPDAKSMMRDAVMGKAGDEATLPSEHPPQGLPENDPIRKTPDQFVMHDWPETFGSVQYHESALLMIDKGLDIDQILSRFASGDFGTGQGQCGIIGEIYAGVYETEQGIIYVRSQGYVTDVCDWMER